MVPFIRTPGTVLSRNIAHRSFCLGSVTLFLLHMPYVILSLVQSVWNIWCISRWYTVSKNHFCLVFDFSFKWMFSNRPLSIETSLVLANLCNRYYITSWKSKSIAEMLNAIHFRIFVTLKFPSLNEEEGLWLVYAIFDTRNSAHSLANYFFLSISLGRTKPCILIISINHYWDMVQYVI